MYGFVSGPMVWISVAVFVAGLAVQGYRFFALTKEKKRVLFPKPEKRPKRPRDLRGLHALGVGLYDDGVEWLRRSMLGTHPAMTAVTVVFHVLLFVTPIFLLGHNTMIENGRLGVGLPSLPEGLTDLLTVVVLCCLAIFLFRRVFLRRVRSITTAYDYLVLAVTAAPFVTGFIAYHQWFDYRTVILIHMIAGELMLILIPFTRLGHALFFFLYRVFIGSEHSFGRGRRAWSVPESGRS